MLLLNCCLFLTLVSCALPSKMDLNFHLDELFDEWNSKNETFTWQVLNERIKTIVDSLLQPNIGGIYKVYKKLHISSDCYESLQGLMMGVRNGKRWAMEMIDASGKIPSGILEGTVIDFGSYDECLKIRVNDSSKYSSGNELFRGRYCMVGYHSPLLTYMNEKTPDGRDYIDAYGTPPEWVYEVLVKSGGYLKRTAFWFGTCVPSTCTKDDILKIATIVGKPLGFKPSISDCQIDETLEWPSYSLASACCLICLLVLCVIGTLIDAVARWRNSNPSSDDDDHVFLRIPKAFSLLRNTENLFCRSVGGGSLACFNGIRFLSATWIVLGHTYFYTDTWQYLKYRHLLGFSEYFDRYLPLAVMENFTVPVGSFFFMSGFLLVYTTWGALQKNKGRINILMFFIHKFWRMTPALGLTIALFFVMPLIDSGPVWKSTLNPPLQQCRNLWWANFLYINNWWNTDEFCLVHTWYLAALMQFHMFGILLLLVAYKWRMVGILLSVLIIVACSTITALLVVWNDYPMPGPGIIKDMDIIESYISHIYIKPFYHLSTYMIGMVMAYIVLRYRDRTIAPKYRVLCWILAVATALSSAFGLYGPAESVAVRATYIVGYRIGWALSIGWMTYACATGHGGYINRLLSWNALHPLGQLSYLTYMLHPLVIIYRSASLRERVYYGHTELVFSFMSNLVVSLFLAYVGFVSVETPFAILEKIIFKRKPRKSYKKFENEDDSKVNTSVSKPSTVQ